MIVPPVHAGWSYSSTAASKWLTQTADRCRSKINKRIETIENRLQKEADKKDGRDLDDIEADQDKAGRKLAKAEKTTGNVKKTLQRIEEGAMFIPAPTADNNDDGLSSGFKKRRKSYITFRKTTASGASKWFNTHLGRKAHAGRLMFDHELNT